MTARVQQYRLVFKLFLRRILVALGMVWQSPPGGFLLTKGIRQVFHPTRGPAWVPGTPMLDAPNGAVIVHQDGRCKLRAVVGGGFEWRVIHPTLAAQILTRQQRVMVRRRVLAGALAGAMMLLGVMQ